MPSIDAAFGFANVTNTFRQAWIATQNTGFEYGGWIKYHAGTDTYTATMRTDNDPTAIMLSSANLIAQQTAGGWQIIGDYHCHPGGGAASCRPSQGDIDNSKNKAYPMFVFTLPWEAHMSNPVLAKHCTPSPAPFAIPNESIGHYAVMWRLN